MSETGNQTSLGGETVSEPSVTPDEEEQQAQNGTLPGIESETDSPAAQSPEQDTGAESQGDGGSENADEQEEAEETLVEFGVDDDPRPNNPKLDNPDGDLQQDRRVNKESESGAGEQEQLFPDVEDDQMTLTGEQARNQCLF